MSVLQETTPMESRASSSAGSRAMSPETPPQIDLGFDPSLTKSFSGLFPWVQQPTASEHPQTIESDTAGHEHDGLAAFNRRTSAQLTGAQLQTLALDERVPASIMPHNDTTSPQGLGHILSLPKEDGAESIPSVGPPAGSVEQDLHVVSSAMAYTKVAPSPASGHAAALATSDQHPSYLAERTRPSMGQSRHSHNFAQQGDLGPSLSRDDHARRSSASSSQPEPSIAVHTPEATVEQQQLSTFTTYDLFEDDKLPGFHVSERGSARYGVRVPRKMAGWKAVLTDLAPSSHDVTKKGRRESKPGRQGWEVRQEAMKNSYDFRRGSGILATMHAGHRLFKHDWHLILKDGSRFVWKMDKHALALLRCVGESEVQVGEFRKAVPTNTSAYGVSTEVDPTRRIGSFAYDSSDEGDMFDADLALASLVAVFAARGGHTHVSAAFEASSDPMRDWLEQKRQARPDREEEMLAMPLPGFARDAESLLSDTTDEDADSVTSDTLPGRRAAVRPTPASRDVVYDDRRASGPEPRTQSKGAKRLSKLFGLGNGTAGRQSEDGAATTADRKAKEKAAMTESQRIARQYRTRSFFGGR